MIDYIVYNQENAEGTGDIKLVLLAQRKGPRDVAIT